ncbi:PIN domain-containing protein [Paractinoplanes atraurantiacus]|uniref:Predicted nucleic acid-binding protein, contains PIN domain n=1 Tax=Paractinoplanes atraurantiacus TaxID=1036182 RepID=A0A285H7Y6_9ACTN|nr:PIN domain-containing protein [Actinoplanes atraurantiacus]SNY30956.1 Predicted nucleic acid-binding protein, contains PIN domain [Actinoplanes atraurantiacus]
MLPVPLRVFLDANVLYSRCLRDWLVLMALDSHYTAYELRWSEAVLAEAFYHLRRAYPEAPERRIEHWRDQLDKQFPEAKVTDWDPQAVPRPRDANDHHVLAAALAGEVDILVTNDGDIDDFQRCLDHVEAGVDVQHVDDFFCMMADRHTKLVRRRFLSQVMYWQRRDELTEEAAADAAIDSLDKAGAARFAFLLRTDERFQVW